jgi:hypothetical protein
MEYYQGAAKLFDFVYATASTDRPEHRHDLSTFFDDYKDSHERYGSYLIAADVQNPLWDSKFTSPEDLRRSDPAAGPHLRLLEKRVEEKMLGANQIEALLALLPDCYDKVGLQRISQRIGIPFAHWFADGTMSEASSALVDVVVERNKLGELVEVVSLEFPGPFAPSEEI